MTTQLHCLPPICLNASEQRLVMTGHSQVCRVCAEEALLLKICLHINI